MVSRFWTLWLPCLYLTFQVGMELSFSSSQLAGLMSENGPVELLQWMAIGTAFAVSLWLLITVRMQRGAWFFAWVALATLCCLYVTGEEISWGQHIMNWSTPDYWKSVNDQEETNLHNVSSWLDQKPRLILLLGIVAGGLIVPFIAKVKPAMLPRRFERIYPPARLVPVALFVLGPYLAQEIAGFFDISLFERVSEVQELYMFYFVLLYMLALRARVTDAA